MPDDDDDLLSLTAAAEQLGVNKKAITRLISRGELTVVGTDPLDRRSKLVRRAEVEALARRSGKGAA
jgi:excisionase family DNA binding protein